MFTSRERATIVLTFLVLTMAATPQETMSSSHPTSLRSLGPFPSDLPKNYALVEAQPLPLAVAARLDNVDLTTLRGFGWKEGYATHYQNPPRKQQASWTMNFFNYLQQFANSSGSSAAYTKLLSGLRVKMGFKVRRAGLGDQATELVCPSHVITDKNCEPSYLVVLRRRGYLVAIDAVPNSVYDLYRVSLESVVNVARAVDNRIKARR